MKYLRILLLLLLLIPFIVLAEECDISKITITSMKPNKIEGNTEVISDPEFEDRTINLNLKMYDINDSITYDLVIKNDSEDDYMIDEDTFKTDSDYIEYSLKTNDNTNIVKANSSKEVSLVVTYKKEVEDDKLTNNKFDVSNSLKLSMNTSNKEKELDIITTDNIKESVDPVEVKNPITSVSSVMIIIIISIISIVITGILIKRKKKYVKYIAFIIGTIIIIPITVYALCNTWIVIESNIIIMNTKATIIDGERGNLLPGNEICWKTECFYVLSSDNDENGETKLIAKNALNKSQKIQLVDRISDANAIEFSRTSYWDEKCNREDNWLCLGIKDEYDGNYDGNPYPYVYDENSYLFAYIQEYVEILKTYGAPDNIKGRLLSFEEATDMGCEYD